MTIDNHPLTPKPVDDREAGDGYHQVLPVDEQLALWTLAALDCTAATGTYAQIVQAFARHREQAERGLREALEAIAEITKKQQLPITSQVHEATRKALDTRP